MNGQLVSAPVSQKVLTPITEDSDGCDNVNSVAEPTNTAGKVSEAGASGSGASTLTIAVPAMSEVYTIGGGERTPDLSSLISDDGSEPVDQHAKRLVKKRSGLTNQLTNDWLATLLSISDADIEPGDNASVLALYNIEGDVDEDLGAWSELGHPPSPEYVLTTGPTASALSLPSIVIDEAAYADIGLDDEVDKLDSQPADERYLRPHSVPAAEDMDVWCEIAASPTVVADVSATPSALVGDTNTDRKQTPEENVDKDAEGKPAPPLSHVFFF